MSSKIDEKDLPNADHNMSSKGSMHGYLKNEFKELKHEQGRYREFIQKVARSTDQDMEVIARELEALRKEAQQLLNNYKQLIVNIT